MNRNSTQAGVVFIVVTLSAFLAPFMASALNVALPVIGREFSIDAVLLGWIATSYILAAAMFLLPFGRIGDLWGRKRVFLLGMIVYAAGSLFSAIAPSAAMLILTRIVSGVGAAMGFATGTAILVSVVAPARRGAALGWNVAAVYIGLAMGPFLGGVITHNLGWRWIFVINAGVGAAVAGLIGWKVTGEWNEARGGRFDAVGSLIYCVTLPVFMFGLSSVSKPHGAGLVVAGLIGLAAFVRWELRARSPVFDVAAFVRNSVFAFSNAAALINYSATAAVSFLLSLYLQYAKDLTAQQAGLVLVAQPVVMALFSPVAGRLSDRLEAGKLASAGMALTVAGLVVFCFLREGSSLWHVISGLVVLGFGFALFSSPNINAVMSSVDRTQYGIASSTLATMRLIGQMLSMGIVMLLMTLTIGPVQITVETRPQVLKCITTAFGVFAVLCVVGVFASVVRGKVPAASRGPAA